MSLGAEDDTDQVYLLAELLRFEGVLKLRGTAHDTAERKLTIDPRGLAIG